MLGPAVEAEAGLAAARVSWARSAAAGVASPARPSRRSDRPLAAGDAAAGDGYGGRGRDRVSPYRVASGTHRRVDGGMPDGRTDPALAHAGVRARGPRDAVRADLDLQAVQLGRRVQDQRSGIGPDVEQHG